MSPTGLHIGCYAATVGTIEMGNQLSTLFFSYSHTDEDLRDRLETHLAMLKRQGVIEAWHDRRIVAGDKLGGSIDRELNRADVILLLVSPDFLASDYCYDVEVKRAMERHEAGEARVIPVILRACDWHSAPFGKLLAVPTDGKPIRSWADLDEAFLDVVRRIRAALPKAAGPTSELQRRPAVPVVTQGPRSSNLRLQNVLTDADRDRFLDEAFAYLSRFFENSMDELKNRNDGIETTFRQIDSNRFTSVVYQSGKAVSRCKILLGGMLGKSITYSNNDRATDGSMNESLTVGADERYLKAFNLGCRGGRKDRHLTHEGAAEYYWSLFIGPLQG